MIRSFLIVFIIVFQTNFLWSQGGLKLVAEYSFNRFETAGMNQFVETFTSFWGSKISTPYQSFTGAELSHPNFGASFYKIFGEKNRSGISMGTGILVGRGKYRNETIWSNGVKNELLFNARDIMWTANLGFHIRHRLFIDGYMDANIRRLTLEHATIYQDGSRSLSSEYKLNGFYNGTVSSIDLGIQVSVRLGRFFIYAKPSWAMTLEAFGKDLITVQDINSNNFPPIDFPADYGVYATDPIGFVEQNLGVKIDDFELFRFAIGLEYMIGGGYDK